MNSLRSHLSTCFPVLLVLLLVTGMPLPAIDETKPNGPAKSSLDERFRDALFAEEAKLDLDTAAKAYEEIIAAFDRDRETAAAALYRLAEVQRKLNRPDSARAAFRRLVREFPDREPHARLARENLKALGDPALDASDAVPAALPVTGISSEEAKELERLRDLAKNSPDLLNAKSRGPKSDASALRSAIQAGHLKVVEFLLPYTGDINFTPEGVPTLNEAAASGHRGMIELLLSKGAKLIPEQKVNAGHALGVAIGHGHRSVVALFLEKGFPLKGSAAVAHFLYTKERDIRILQMLLDAGADPNEGAVVSSLTGKEAPPVPEYAGLPQRSAQMQQIIPPRPSVIHNPGAGNTELEARRNDPLPCLTAACAIGDGSIIDLLLAKGANVNAKSPRGTSALEVACVLNDTERAALLLKAGADAKHVAPGGVRLTDIAAFHLNVELYRQLRAAGAEANGTGPCGKTVWHFLLNNPDPGESLNAFVEAIIADGVEFQTLPDQTDPLVKFAGDGNLPIVKLLIAKGADMKRTGKEPILIPVIKAFISNRIKRSDAPDQARWNTVDVITPVQRDVVQSLIEAGADINRPGLKDAPYQRGGLTPLHYLAVHMYDMHVDSLEALLSFKPDPHVRSAYSIKQDGSEGTERFLPADLVRQGEVATSPAARRLWEYTWMENNPQRKTAVWLNRYLRAGAGSNEPGQSFTQAAPAGSSASVADVLVAIFDGTQDEARAGTDFRALSIQRMDPASGRTVKTEPVDFDALTAAGDVPAIPILQPGDILNMPIAAGSPPVTAWYDFPEPLGSFIRKAVTRRITLRAGEWTRTFSVVPPREGFRWDPATDMLAVPATATSLARFTPKPDFFYNLSAATVKPRTGDPVTLDLTKESPEKSRVLADGDELILTPASADSPELEQRMAEGLFVSREADGFLREVFRNTGAPEGVTNEVRLADLVLAAYLADSWVLPFLDEASVRPPASPDAPPEAFKDRLFSPLKWGTVIECERNAALEGKPWALQEFTGDKLTTRVTLVRRNRMEYPRALAGKMNQFQLTQDGWMATADARVPVFREGEQVVLLKAMTLNELVTSLLEPDAMPSDWELRAERFGKPLRFDLSKGEIPFVTLKNGDTLLVGPDEPLAIFKSSAQPPRTVPPGAPGARRRVVLPTPSQ